MKKETLKPEYKIIADHVRSACFLIADGIIPSNEGKGYVLRRILRRAILQTHKLAIKQDFLHLVANRVIEIFRTQYPNLSTARDTIIENIKIEEKKFKETIEKGLKILREEFNNNDNKSKKVIKGEIAFKLHDTFGFPLDLTVNIAKENDTEVDLEGFNTSMLKQRNKAKDNWVGSGESSIDKIFFILKDKYGATEFDRNNEKTFPSKIIAIVADNVLIESINDINIDNYETIYIITNKTPFYGTSGGQKGDNGQLLDSLGNKIDVDEAKIQNKIILHRCNNQSIKRLSKDSLFSVFKEITLVIDSKARLNRSKNHSATHILHYSLKKLINSSISQKGSNVDAESFTFDFNFNRSLTAQEIEDIENFVNTLIQDNNPAEIKTMKLDLARQIGAEALFGENYEDDVRVITIGKSIELCGGTHINSSGEIGIFKIISEKSIASGIRRIEAKTGIEALQYIRNKQQQLEKTLEEQVREIKKINQEQRKIKEDFIARDIINSSIKTIKDYSVAIYFNENIDSKTLPSIINQLRKNPKLEHKSLILLFAINKVEEKISIALAITNDIVDKFNAVEIINKILPIVGGTKCGGKPEFAMSGAKDIDKIELAIKIFAEIINS
jgi:alanyl-tRNA synthetase